MVVIHKDQIYALVAHIARDTNRLFNNCPFKQRELIFCRQRGLLNTYGRFDVRTSSTASCLASQLAVISVTTATSLPKRDEIDTVIII